MENIIDNMKNFIFKNDCDVLDLQDDHKKAIKIFLDNPNMSNAKDLFKIIGESQKKDQVFGRLEDLSNYEESFHTIIPEQKDHYFHSASVYVMGLSLYNKMPIVRKKICVERLVGIKNEKERQKTAFLRSWSIAACLHDIGYPFELSIRAFNKLTSKYYREEYKYLAIDYKLVTEKLIMPPLSVEEKYINLDTAFKIIASRIKRNSLPILSMDTIIDYFESYYLSSLESGIIDHGLISSLIVLNDLYDYYKENNLNFNVFYQDMADAVTAIFLHNFYRHSNLKKYCNTEIYNFDYPNSLGCLLFVCDTICEWFRRDKRNFDDFSMKSIKNITTFYIKERHRLSLQESVQLFDNKYFRVEFV